MNLELPLWLKINKNNALIHFNQGYSYSIADELSRLHYRFVYIFQIFNLLCVTKLYEKISNRSNNVVHNIEIFELKTESVRNFPNKGLIT